MADDPRSADGLTTLIPERRRELTDISGGWKPETSARQRHCGAAYMSCAWTLGRVIGFITD